MPRERPKQKPLSYLSSKCVIPFLEFNLRLSLSQRCPSFPSMEKNATIRIDYLSVNPHEIRINKTSYKLGIIQIYRCGNTPRTIRHLNSQGGLCYDVDEYGIQDQEISGNMYYPDVFKEEYRFSLETLETKKRELEDKISRCPYKFRKEQLEELKNRIDDIRCKYVPFELQKENGKPPYDHYLQLMTSSEEKRKYERLTYKKTIQQAMFYLFDKRIFKGNKVYIKNLKTHFNVGEVLDLIRPLLVNNLNNLEINRMIENDLIIKNAKSLTIFDLDVGRCLPLLSNYRIHFYNRNSGETEILNFCKRPVVDTLKHYSLEYKDKRKAVRVFDEFFDSRDSYIGQISETIGTAFPLCVTFPKSEDLEINIYVEETTKLPNPGDEPIDIYVLHFKINRQGYCDETVEIERPQRRRPQREVIQNSVIVQRRQFKAPMFCLNYCLPFVIVLVIFIAIFYKYLY